MMSEDTGNGDWFPLTTAARLRSSGSGRCSSGPVSPQISEHWYTVALNRKGGVACVSIVYTQRELVGVLQVTGSLILLILVCCCIVLCYRSSCDCLPVPAVYLESLIQFVCGVTDNRRTVSTDCIVGAMASGYSRPEADRSGVNFLVRIKVDKVDKVDIGLTGVGGFRYIICCRCLRLEDTGRRRRAGTSPTREGPE